MFGNVPEQKKSIANSYLIKKNSSRLKQEELVDADSMIIV